MIKRRLDTHLALVFGVTVMLALAGVILFVNNRAAAILDGATQALFANMTGESRAHIDKSFTSVEMLTRLFATDPQAASHDSERREKIIERFRIVMDATPFTSAIYVGYDDGDFLLLRHLTSQIARRNLNAPDNARYLLQTVDTDSAGSRAPLTFLDDQLKPVGTVDRRNFSFDPRERGWYRDALTASGPVLTDPYRFFATAEIGVTIAHRLEDGTGVIGVDVSLADLSQELRRLKSTPSSEIIITNPAGMVIAASSPAATLPAAFRSAAPSRAARQGAGISSIVPLMLATIHEDKHSDHTSTVTDGGRDWTMHVAPLQSGPWTFHVAAAVPNDELMASLRALLVTLGWISVGLMIAVIIAIHVTARAVSRPLVAIAREAEAIQSFNFKDLPGGTRSSVREIDTLSRAIQNARMTIQRFIEIGRTLAAERDPDRLVDRLLQETISITAAESGLILLSEDDGRTFTVVTRQRHAEAPEHQPGGQGCRLTHGDSGLGGRIINALAQRAITHFDLVEPSEDPLFVELAEGLTLGDDEVFRFSLIPLLNRGDETIGGLVLVSRVDREALISNDSLDLARALSGNAAVAIETTLVLKSRKSLLDAVIRMIAQATDAKSPYTNGHCQRVPIITHALASAACDIEEGPYADFALTPEEWEAVDVAAWLHDCGKLTTAEYVMDKATKLETINNRIHEIRMRFELLKATANAEYWRGLATGNSEPELRAVRDRELAALDDDFAFVATCNEGGEFMEPEKIARLKQIARRTWLRTLDDRIGISSDEKRRKNRTPPAPLPAQEQLLDDRPDHIVEHYPNQLSDLEEKAGFRMARPAHRLNLGEIYNLSIGRGTLTAEERFEINRHVTRSIVMLEALPLSGALTKVPEYAGGHHERMDGRGYPRALTRDEMSPIARMMAIADVFEALTAADRPYKKAKSLSEAIRIMGEMKRDNHLDPDLLDLFLRSGLWRDYAERYLDPAQIDQPDIDAVLAIHAVRKAAA